MAAVRALVWAYLRSALNPDDPAWAEAVAVLAAQPTPWGRVEVAGGR
nr:hypothetical protein [Kineosporia sp. NBRC 101731]